MTALNLKIIKSYGFQEKITNPDWDDVRLEIELPNGLYLSCLTVCNNEPCDCDALYGLDEFLKVTSKEQLDELIRKDFKDIVMDVANKYPDEFNSDEWI